jgi:hypothetical protein
MPSQIFSRFTTPVPKLVQFFERSRDKWKDKAIERNRNLKSVKNQVYAVTKSRDQWKERAKASDERIEVLEREIALLKCRG